jgi:outer membrane protein OmpA-like peptidoglycan-associated protein
MNFNRSPTRTSSRPSFRLSAISILGAAALAACSTVPLDNAMLEQARSDYRSAQANSQTQALAPNEMKLAGEALGQADAAQARRDEVIQVNHLAYIARQRVAVAQETANRKASEAAVAEATALRDQMRLAARTREADRATQTANAATRDARDSQRQSEASQREAQNAQQQAQAAQQQAQSAQQQAAAAQMQAGEAERRAQALEKQLTELNAKKTERGMVITMGDVLFDTGRADLKSGAMQNVQRLGGFLKEYPKRRAAIEGYTDSTGSDATNMALSARRAESVMNVLLNMGVDRAQLMAQGYGPTHPVAGNDNASGRQMNRRVEIVLSDENGAVAPR